MAREREERKRKARQTPSRATNDRSLSLSLRCFLSSFRERAREAERGAPRLLQSVSPLSSFSYSLSLSACLRCIEICSLRRHFHNLLLLLLFLFPVCCRLCLCLFYSAKKPAAAWRESSSVLHLRENKLEATTKPAIITIRILLYTHGGGRKKKQKGRRRRRKDGRKEGGGRGEKS